MCSFRQVNESLKGENKQQKAMLVKKQYFSVWLLPRLMFAAVAAARGRPTGATGARRWGHFTKTVRQRRRTSKYNVSPVWATGTQRIYTNESRRRRRPHGADEHGDDRVAERDEEIHRRPQADRI